MGVSFFDLDGLGAPLDRALDRQVLIPAGNRLSVVNPQPKVVILFEGAFRVSVDGREQGELHAGDALIVPEKCQYVYAPLEPGRETRLYALVVLLRPGRFPCEGQEALLQGPGTAAGGFLWRYFSRVQRRRGVVSPALQEWMEALRREADRQEAGFRLRAAAYLTLMLTEIVRQGDAAAPPGESRSRSAWLVEKTRHFLAEHHAEALSLDRIAWHLRLSGEHLARTFRQETGETVFGALERLRLERACAELAGSRLRVAEIARLTGFGTSAQFCRVFRRAMGETPLAYRLRMAGRGGAFLPGTMEEIV